MAEMAEEGFALYELEPPEGFKQVSTVRYDQGFSVRAASEQLKPFLTANQALRLGIRKLSTLRELTEDDALELGLLVDGFSSGFLHR